jgi:hypothetical protein
MTVQGNQLHFINVMIVDIIYHSEWNVHDKKPLFAFVIGMEAFLQAIFVHSDRGVARE